MKYYVRVLLRIDEPFRIFFNRKPFSRVLWDLQIGWLQIYRAWWEGDR